MNTKICIFLPRVKIPLSVFMSEIKINLVNGLLEICKERMPAVGLVRLASHALIRLVGTISDVFMTCKCV